MSNKYSKHANTSRREDARDAVLMRPGSAFSRLSDLPLGSVVGTSSVRRAAQIRAKFPGLVIRDVRGNLNTRLRKLDADDGEYSALILAAAGVVRMGWTQRISEVRIRTGKNLIIPQLVLTRSLLRSPIFNSTSRNLPPLK
jgi:porphobilinogen deaminase